MRYLYASHMGGLYVSDDYLGFEETYCETCGDCDQLIGEFETVNNFWNLIEDKCDILGSGGYSLQYVYQMMVKLFDLPDKIEYDNYQDQLMGHCNAKEGDIVIRIEELIGRDIYIEDYLLDDWDEEV